MPGTNNGGGSCSTFALHFRALPLFLKSNGCSNRIHTPRDAEVCQLGDDFRAQQGKQDVGRHDDQMHQVGQVQREETVGDSAQYVQALHSREGG